ncbi:MAG: hypothetical protein U1E06_09245 [Tabrizicola sp.]|uniref:hypothetical protein n=1 Tax=Tabrizicola sp. TaxID=2005166 RepID=UPI00273372A1|nr:hypothetical protein [Tabrizicola sp.]MDZ4067026.1 hypothetical protein [Tabrizicola sp.]
MLHVVNLDLMRVSVRYRPDGSALDPHERHRREVVLHLSRARSAARMARLAALGAALRMLFGAARHVSIPDAPAACVGKAAKG